MKLVVCSQHQREKGGVFPHLYQLHKSNSPLLLWLTFAPILAASQLQGVAAMTRRVQAFLVLHPLLSPLALLIPASRGRCPDGQGHHWALAGSRINATRMFTFKSFILSGSWSLWESPASAYHEKLRVWDWGSCGQWYVLRLQQSV